MSEIMIIEPAGSEMANPVIEALEDLTRRQNEALVQMAFEIKAMAAGMDELRQEVRRLRKITPMQVTELNALVRRHCRELCEQYGIEEYNARVNALIRSAVKKEFGIGSMKELCESDYTIAMSLIKMWDDYDKLMNMRR